MAGMDASAVTAELHFVLVRQAEIAAETADDASDGSKYFSEKKVCINGYRTGTKHI
jgi:hypothetical protein